MINKTLQMLLILLFCLSGSAFAQDLHIFYDAETTMIRYELDGVEIKRPKVKKDGNIFLHVENYNNYIYSIQVDANNQMLQIPSGNGIGNIISIPGGGGGGFTGGFNSGAGDGYINIDGGGGGIEDDDGGFGFATEEDSDFTAFQALYAEYEGIIKNMEKKESVFTEIQQEVVGVEKKREFRSIGLAEIQKIKWNPNFSTNQIKRMSYEFLNKILEIQDTSQLTLDYIIQKGDDRQKLLNSLGRLEKNSKDYERSINDLGLFSEKLKGVDMSFDEFYALQTNVDEVYNGAVEVQESVAAQRSVIDEMYANTGTKELQKMTSIWYEYEGLIENDFTYTYRTEATGDRTVLGLKFTARDSLGNVLPINKKELAPIKVSVYGGMKINVSIGISFAGFFNQPQSYYLQDTIIKSENADAFLPIITSFFHFYPQSAGNVSVGGNFGIGIPLTNSDAGQSLSFFLGPSFIIGKGQRIVLSTGVMGGKVQQLAQGLEVGDELPPFSPVPTKTAYELGYFLGVSFNIGGNN